jgi:Hsp20/alpha crystallin family
MATEAASPAIRVEEYAEDLRLRGESGAARRRPGQGRPGGGGRWHSDDQGRAPGQSHEGGRSEFRYGSFVRQLPLPADATEADVTARYTDGILEVAFPMTTKPTVTRKVPINRKS